MNPHTARPSAAMINRSGPVRSVSGAARKWLASVRSSISLACTSQSAVNRLVNVWSSRNRVQASSTDPDSLSPGPRSSAEASRRASSGAFASASDMASVQASARDLAALPVARRYSCWISFRPMTASSMASGTAALVQGSSSWRASPMARCSQSGHLRVITSSWGTAWMCAIASWAVSSGTARPASHRETFSRRAAIWPKPSSACVLAIKCAYSPCV